MVARERRLDRAKHRTARALIDIGLDFRNARLSANLTLGDVESIVGISSSEISRIELGQAPHVPYSRLALVAAALGLDLPLRTFPSGDPVRDRAQLALLGRFHARLSRLRHVAEVGLPRPGDPRAWDEVVFGDGWSIPVDAESRLRDIQLVQRRTSLKLRDSGHDRVILLVADTRHNRHVLRLAAESLAGAFPLVGRQALADLEQGRCPASSAIILL